MKNKQNFIVETTASSRGTLKFIDQAKENGFIIEVSFVTLKDTDLNNLRIQQRVADGWHFIEPDIVKRRFKKSMLLMPEILAKSDHVKLIDNTRQFEIVLTKTRDIIKIHPNQYRGEIRLTELLKVMKKFNPALKSRDPGFDFG